MASEMQINGSTDAKDIALAELAKWRRRLGPLTHEQELRIENLVISTANKVSLMSGRVMQSLLDRSERSSAIEVATSSRAIDFGAVPESVAIS